MGNLKLGKHKRRKKRQFVSEQAAKDIGRTDAMFMRKDVFDFLHAKGLYL